MTSHIHTARSAAGYELGFIKFHSLDCHGVSEHMFSTKPEGFGKEVFWPAKATVEASKGNQSSKGPLEVRNRMYGWGKGRYSPGLGLQGEEKNWTPTPFAVAEELSSCIFLACLPVAHKSLLPGPWIPCDPGSQVLETSRLSPALGFLPSCCILWGSIVVTAWAWFSYPCKVVGKEPRLGNEM